MKKIELNQIIGFLPYKLKCQYEGILNGKELSIEDKRLNGIDCFSAEYTCNILPIIGLKIAELKEIKIYKNYWTAHIGTQRRGLKTFVCGHDFKPILRPLSDLTKPCLENGKTPIAELMDKSFNTNWAKTEYIYTESGKNEWWVAFKDQNSCFGYNSEKQGFYSINNSCKDLYVYNQLQLFEMLFEWHFDIYGLIVNGFAIDINTLSLVVPDASGLNNPLGNISISP